MRHFCQFLYHVVILLWITFVTAKEYIIEFSTVEQSTLFLKENEEYIQNVRYNFDSDILIGTAIEFKEDTVAKRILVEYPSITRYWPIQHHIRQQAPIPQHHHDNHAVVPNFFVPQNNDTLSVLTQANNVYKQLKSNGAGIKVGIIDSGVDYTLPALGGCLGVGCKVAYGHDLVGDHFDGSLSSIKESTDPIDNCPSNSSATGHGTFITGIIAAEDKTYNWNGVAPGVSIGMWRVYGCKSQSVPNDILIKAMEMAYKANMDVINISNGFSGGWAEDVLSIVADRLVSQGVHVVTATGNIGTSGVFLTASPASGKNVIASGSIMNNHVPGYVLKLTTTNNSQSEPKEIAYRTYVNTPFVLNGTYPLVATSKQFNAENDACQNMTSHSLKDSIALIHTGGCNALSKIMHAQQAGAKAVIMYTDVKNTTTNFQVLPQAVLPVAFINQQDANIAFYQANQAEFTNILIAMEAPESSTVSAFSTLGPTNELDLKPELMAIGGNVFSTLPRSRKSYGFASGTSFSAPYISGSIALYLANTKLDQTPEQVKSILMNSARQVKGPISEIHYGDSPIRQGAGVIDVVQAIENYNNQFHVSPAKLSLNDTAHFQNEHIIEVFNNLEKEATFILSHVPSLTVTGYYLDKNHTNYTPREPIGLYGQPNSTAMVTFSDTRLIVPAGQSLQVRVHIQPPNTTFSLQSHALYGGYISIQQQESATKATVPYIGMIGNMHDLPILDRSTNPSPSAQYTFPSIGLANGLTILKPNSTAGHFHIQGRTGGPYILVRLLTGTKILQFQVLHEGMVIGDIPIDETRNYMMRNTLEVVDYSKSYYTWNWHGDIVPTNTTLSGTNNNFTPQRVSSGQYKIKIRALRVFGNIENDRDWDEWISPNLMLKI